MNDREFQKALLYNVQIFKDKKIRELVELTIRGYFGDGEKRTFVIKSKGYNYETVQKAVDFLYAYTKEGICVNEKYHWFSE